MFSPIATLNILYCINNLWLNNVSSKSNNFLVLGTIKIDLSTNILHQNFTQVLSQAPRICWSEAWPVAWRLAVVGVGVGGCRSVISSFHFLGPLLSPRKRLFSRAREGRRKKSTSAISFYLTNVIGNLISGRPLKTHLFIPDTGISIIAPFRRDSPTPAD